MHTDVIFTKGISEFCLFSLFYSNRGGEQDIQLTNDKRVVSHFSDPKSTGKAADPGNRFWAALMHLSVSAKFKLASGDFFLSTSWVFLLASDFHKCPLTQQSTDKTFLSCTKESIILLINILFFFPQRTCVVSTVL